MRKILSQIYHSLRRIIETNIIGTKLEELIWSTRHIWKGKKWLTEHWQSQHERPRLKEMLKERIAAHSPVNSILEIGCGAGQYLVYLQKFSPQTNFYGMDINKKVIDFGAQKIKEAGIKNIFLKSGRADDLSGFNDKSVDVVFTVALLIYVGKDKIEKTMREILRVARKIVILIEPAELPKNQDKSGLGRYNAGQWLRDYSNLVQRIGIPSERIKTIKIPKDVWWNEPAGVNIIEIKL